MSSARSDADKITTIFMKHWAEFKKELSVAKELEHAEDKRLAWTMFLTGASMFLYNQTKQGKKREKQSKESFKQESTEAQGARIQTCQNNGSKIRRGGRDQGSDR